MNKESVERIMDALGRSDRQPLFDAMADDVSWRWMGAYDNNYCWIFAIRDGLSREIREYLDTQLVTETFAHDPS